MGDDLRFFITGKVSCFGPGVDVSRIESDGRGLNDAIAALGAGYAGIRQAFAVQYAVGSPVITRTHDADITRRAQRPNQLHAQPSMPGEHGAVTRHMYEGLRQVAAHQRTSTRT